MPRNIVQDVIPRSDRRNISREPSHSRREKFSDEADNDAIDENNIVDDRDESETKFSHHEKDDTQSENWGYGRPGKTSRWLLWIIGVVSAAVLIFVLGNIFSGATVTITPKSQKLSVNLDLTARPKATTLELGYTVYSATLDKEEVVPSDGERPVVSKASGTIIVYNNYSASAQRLVKNTRFETPDGLIYKIANSITIPGRHTVSGETVPGSVEIKVYAESSGDEYNIGLTDFTIPGFKSNAERYANFYGRSKTVMAGGKVGTEKFVSDDKLKQAREQLDSELTKELVAQARSSVPADLVFYDDAYQINFEPALSSRKVSDNDLPVSERAHFTAFFLKRDGLAQTISQNLIDGYNGTPVEIINPEMMKFTWKNPTDINSTVVGPIKFNLKGDTTIVWKFDEGKLGGDLAGKNKSELAEIAGKYPSIVKAEVVVRPFWTSTFPAVVSKIKFVTSSQFE